MLPFDDQIGTLEEDSYKNGDVIKVSVYFTGIASSTGALQTQYMTRKRLPENATFTTTANSPEIYDVSGSTVVASGAATVVLGRRSENCLQIRFDKTSAYTRHALYGYNFTADVTVVIS